MWRLFRKFSFHYITYMIPFMVFMAFYLLEYKEKGGVSVIMLQTFWTWLMISGSISGGEKYEEKNKGYHFLKILPIEDKHIIWSKYLLALIAVIVSISFNILVFRAYINNDDLFRIMITFSVIWNVFCLIYAGLIHIGIFRYGYTKMFKIFWTLAFVIFAGFVLSNIFLPKMNINIRSVLNIAKSRIWIFFLAGGLVIYYQLMKIALKVKQNMGDL